MTAVVAAPAAAYLLLKPKSSGANDLGRGRRPGGTPRGHMPREVVYYRTRVDGWKRSREKATAWVVKTADQKAIGLQPHLSAPWAAFIIGRTNAPTARVEPVAVVVRVSVPLLYLLRQRAKSWGTCTSPAGPIRY